MSTSTLTSKGQVTIPSKVRASMGLDTGDRIEFIEMDDGTFTIMAATHTVKDLKGMIRKPARSVSIEDMNAAIKAQGAAAK